MENVVFRFSLWVIQALKLQHVPEQNKSNFPVCTDAQPHRKCLPVFPTIHLLPFTFCFQSWQPLYLVKFSDNTSAQTTK